jgi:prolipoprotein diacylglyceryltransferase
MVGMAARLDVAYDYPHNVINEGIPIESCHGSHCHILETPVFPTSLYEFSICALFFVGLWFSRKRIKIAGLLFGIYLVLNGVERYIIEGIRVNIQYDVAGGLTQARIIAICLILGGIALRAWLILKRKK